MGCRLSASALVSPAVAGPSELATAAAEGLRLIVVVIDNGGFAWIGRRSGGGRSERLGTGAGPVVAAPAAPPVAPVVSPPPMPTPVPVAPPPVVEPVTPPTSAWNAY